MLTEIRPGLCNDKYHGAVGANWDDRLAGRVCDQAGSFARALLAAALLCAAVLRR